MWLVIALAVIVEILMDVMGALGLWIPFGILSFIELLLILYIVLGVVVIVKALYVKRRTYDDVLSQDKKFNIPENISVIPFEKVTIKGIDGYDMVASYMESRTGESHKYFIICHGYNSNRVTCNKYAGVLLDMGYNTLCPDMRRCGETGGEGITFGVKESQDIELWIDYIKSKDSEAEISLYGISLGAASSVMVASMRDDISMLVSYCSYASLREIILDRMTHSKVPMFLAKLLYPFVEQYVEARYGRCKSGTDIVECIKKVQCPILIMHSNGDRFTNIKHAYELHEARLDATFVEFDGAPHARAYGVYPEEYRAVLTDFVRSVESGEHMEDRHITSDDEVVTSSEEDNTTL